MKNHEMSSRDAANLIRLFDENGIEVYVDGGWGIDALLGEQTRKHGDIDIAIPHRYVGELRKLLEARGYKDIPRDDTRECNFVLGDENGRQIDIHTYELDEDGNNTFGVAYEARHLTGSGYIDGYKVKCIPPEVMIEFHTGYDLDEDDYHDVKAICERFGIELPQEYKRFEN